MNRKYVIVKGVSEWIGVNQKEITNSTSAECILVICAGWYYQDTVLSLAVKIFVT